MRRVALVVAAIALLSRGGVLTAQSGNPAVPRWPDDFEYLGSTTLRNAPVTDTYGTAVGDWKWGKGLAVRIEADGTVGVYTGSWNPQAVLRWRANADSTGHFAGDATFIRSLGSSIPFHGEVFGLYWDVEDGREVLLDSFNSTYDTDGAIDLTFGRSAIDPATGLLIQTDGGPGTHAMRFANRSDKMTQGGIMGVPLWWRQKYADCSLMAGFGGYWSVIATGPASMGPALTCFNPPTPVGGTDTSVPIPNTPVLGFPYSSSTTTQTPATQRIDTDYKQTFHWGWWPQLVTSAPGWWVPGDQLWQGCAWVDTDAVSGPVCVPTLQDGCSWYGDNHTPQSLPYLDSGELCASYPGKAAALNSERASHWIFTFDPADLGAVAVGQRAQTSVQPTAEVPVQFPGISYPLSGMPGLPRMVTGVAFEPTRHLFAVLVRDTTSTSGRPTIFWYHVRDAGAAAPINTPPTVAITQPAVNTSSVQGQAVAFAATASDPEDGDLSPSVAWASSLDGALGTGASFSTTRLSAGTHVVTASVSDADGLSAAAAVTVTVTPGPITLGAIGYKVKGVQYATLTWQGATGAAVDIYRNGSRVATAPNTGSYTDMLDAKSKGTYTWQVCNAGTATCSSPISFSF